MKIIHLSREKMEKFVSDVPFFVFSITDPTSDPAKFTKDNLIGELRMQFHDLDDLNIKRNPQLANEFVLFNEKHAEEVVSWLQNIMWEKVVQRIVCHCEAGISRSAGMAAAISKILFDNDDEWFAKIGRAHV